MLDQLITTIHKKKENGGPYILLLGAGSSVSSGCPSAKELTESLIKEYNLPLDSKIHKLQDVEEKLKRPIFNLSLEKYFSDSFPSRGYWFLAELIKKGYFDLIFTTNYDSCLEKTLGKIMNYDKFRVCIRGDINDKRIYELIELPNPKIKIIKLHGDYQSRNMSVKPQDLWDLQEPLKTNLSNKINNRWIISIGYSMHDSPIFKILPNDIGEKFWYVDKNSPKSDPVTNSNLDHTGINDEHIIDGNEGDFDEFFTLLSKGLGKIIDPNKEFFNNKKDMIIETCKIQEVDTYKLLFEDLGKLCKKIMKFRVKNLVFIHDPDAPGGSEILKLIERRHTEVIKERNIFKLNIKGRGKKERKAAKLELIKENISNSSKEYLLIDSVSFSGRTLEICREYLIKEMGEDITVVAAVIYSGRAQEKKLSEENYCFNKELFLKVEPINTHQILFPWGLTQATEQIGGEEPKPNTIDEYIPHKYFSFLPRPWGNIFSMMENKPITVKILYLNPREMTSKHKHFIRNEIFFVLDERVILQVWDEHILLRKGDSFRVPVGTEHRLIGLDEPCRILEISQNYHDQKEDIKRLEDKYGRENKKGDV